MRHVRPRRLRVYRTPNGRSPFLTALGCHLLIESLKDTGANLHRADENYPGTPREGADPNLEVSIESSDIR